VAVAVYFSAARIDFSANPLAKLFTFVEKDLK
jgi:hypothetical protein